VGVSPQADNQPWPDDFKLTMQIGLAVLLLVGKRLAVAGRVTMHHVGDEGVILGDASEPESAVQDESATTCERNLRRHTRSTQALSDHHNWRYHRSVAWRCLGFAGNVHSLTAPARRDLCG